MGQLTMFNMVREQLAASPPVPTADLTRKTVMVLGANTGLGFEASKHFALMKPRRLILACRSKERGEAAVEKLEKETGYKGAELWMVDLSDFSSVTAFADKFEQDGGRLDILVENAALATKKYTKTVDGWESTMQVNCLATFLVALRLLPQMIETGRAHGTRPRLVIVCSEVHFWSQIPKEVYDGENIYKTVCSEEFNTNVVGRYNDSKLFDIFFHKALNERLGPQSPVIVNGVNPGFCYSELRREVTGLRFVSMWLMEKAIARTTEQGSRQLLYAALGGSEDEMRGAYVSSAKVAEPSDFVIGEEGRVIQDKLWREVLDILSNVDPRVKDVEKKHLLDLP
ncbi:hypothetical protein DXG01_006207 [Tephrocybe rancida]|nr:hypothetical protein DXG01_006207 [Tephrocybe rancida]